MNAWHGRPVIDVVREGYYRALSPVAPSRKAGMGKAQCPTKRTASVVQSIGCRSCQCLWHGGGRLSGTEKIELVQEITESVTSRLQQMLPAYLAGYSAGSSAPGAMAVPPATAAPSQGPTSPHQQENEDTMPDFDDSCMDFDFISG